MVTLMMITMMMCRIVSRLDSLVILDVLLAQCPSLMAGTATRLLPNLVRLIAQPRQLANNSSSHHGPKSTTSSLIVNPNSRLSTQKWRVRVLRRLVTFFDAIVGDWRQQFINCTSSSSSPVVMVTDTATRHHSIESSTHITQASLHQFLLRFLRLYLVLYDRFDSHICN